MSTRHYAHWPRSLPYDITIPATSLYVNLAISAARYPDKPAVVFYDTAISSMVVDLLADPDLDKYDLSSLMRITGGGAAMPEAVAGKLMWRQLQDEERNKAR